MATFWLHQIQNQVQSWSLKVLLKLRKSSTLIDSVTGLNLFGSNWKWVCIVDYSNLFTLLLRIATSQFYVKILPIKKLYTKILINHTSVYNFVFTYVLFISSSCFSTYWIFSISSQICKCLVGKDKIRVVLMQRCKLRTSYSLLNFCVLQRF